MLVRWLFALALLLFPAVAGAATPRGQYLFGTQTSAVTDRSSDEGFECFSSPAPNSTSQIQGDGATELLITLPAYILTTFRRGPSGEYIYSTARFAGSALVSLRSPNQSNGTITFFTEGVGRIDDVPATFPAKFKLDQFSTTAVGQQQVELNLRFRINTQFGFCTIGLNGIYRRGF